MSTIDLRLGDCLDVMRSLDAASVDAVVTDPPYGINFMGKAWDGKAIAEAAARAPDTTHLERLTGGADGGPRKLTARTASAYATRAGEAGAYDFSAKGNRAFQQWTEAWATEALRVLKPGGHAVVFGGTRTYHRMVCGLEDAGFEIRDQLAWMFGSGFPKSLDVSKAIDAAAGAEREIVETIPDRWAGKGQVLQRATQDERDEAHITAPATDAAREWQGWGTALKPGYEPVVLARKPLCGTVAGNVLEHGVGALNVNGCRIGTEVETWPASRSYAPGQMQPGGVGETQSTGPMPAGRWPANVLLDPAAAAMLDEQSGEMASPATYTRKAPNAPWHGTELLAQQAGDECVGYGDTGGASRFFTTVAPDNVSLPCEVVTTAEPSSSPDTPEAGTAPSDAATSDSHGAKQRSASKARSTSATRTTSDVSAENGTPTIPSTDSASSRESSHDGHTLFPSPANDAGPSEPTDTTTTTRSRRRSAGSAGSVTSPDTSNSTAHGERVWQPDLDVVRFNYCAKVDSAERNAGLSVPSLFSQDGPDRNVHPTVKPVDLMRWLCRLVTPPGGLILDPFMGSGSTGIAAHLEGFDFVGVESEPEYMEIARARISHWAAQEVAVA